MRFGDLELIACGFYSIIRDVKKVLFYNFKIYFIYFTMSFYNSPDIPISIFIYNSLK